MAHQKNQMKTQLVEANTKLDFETKQREKEREDSLQQMQAAKEEWNQERLRAEEKRNEERQRAKEDLLAQISSMKEEATQQKTESEKALKDRYEAQIEAQEKYYKDVLDAQQRKFDETIEKMTAQLKLATDEMLKERQKEFAESSNTNLGQIVTPLKETIEEMKKAMNENTKNQATLTGSLSENIRNMMLQSEAARKSTDELTRVFKHGSKVQGDWGETVLNELLEAQGLTEGVHYKLQPYIRDAQGEISKSEEGSMMRPDVILHLDQRREVIIDSKVSLTAYIEYVNAENETEREKWLKAHVDSINKHVKELSNKDYSKYIEKPKVKMDYVIMFVPNTGALLTAMNAQPDLWRRAMEKNVYIADEQTLYAALRIINLTWTQITQIQNHEQVYKLANVMIDRVGLFMDRYLAIGSALDKAKDFYDKGMTNLKPEGKSIIQTCNQLIKLGAKQSNKNPLPQLTDIDDIPAIEAPEKEETEAVES
ncbi:MAG: DNA recombination protein RmuC [Bacteroidaceae bacterium]|nr:DNA recombination protein RmuC [Bacteroidaceae bacterium]